MNDLQPSITVVTPTFYRPQEIKGLLENLSRQSVIPSEVIIVDGAPAEEIRTEQTIQEIKNNFAFKINYVRFQGGTAIQRNAGIDLASGDLVALIDDDVRLDENFFEKVADVFRKDLNREVGGVVGYRTNQHFKQENSSRWRWYKRLKLLTVYEPGRYDFNCGYPINNNMQPPFSGIRDVDFMTTACAVWRREVFDSGLRFDPFFRDYGILEDAHFSLRAARKWKLYQCGDAHCQELHSPNGRVNRRKIGYKCVVNYYYVFRDITPRLSLAQKLRFWRYQAFEFFRIGSSAIRRRNWGDVMDLYGRLEGIYRILKNDIANEQRVQN